jgi:hypothetical protein
VKGIDYYRLRDMEERFDNDHKNQN